MDFPQVYIEGNANSHKITTKGRIKGGKFTVDPAQDTFPQLESKFQLARSSYMQSHMEEANNTGGFKFIEMVRSIIQCHYECVT